MRNFIKHYLWFIKESFSYMQGHNRVWILVNAVKKGYKFSLGMCQWDKMTAAQREYWYLTADRTIKF